MNITSKQLFRLSLALACIFSAVSAQASGLTLNFNSPGGTILDNNGVGSGFSARMSGTGENITGNDTNLTLNAGSGFLTMQTSPGADINGGAGMADATIVGVQLSTLGFFGTNDFSASATFINITNALLQPDQLCLVVGTASSNMIRAGFINFSGFGSGNEGFGVNTVNSSDLAGRFFGTLVGSTMKVDISRVGGTWSVRVNNINRMPNTAADGTGVPVPPTFLDTEADLFVGVVALDVFNDSPWNVNLDVFTVNVVEAQTAPEISDHPDKQIANEGNPVSFSVSVTPETASPRSYQWRHNGTNLTDQTDSTLTLNPGAAEAGSYTVVVTNSLGSITSSVAPLLVVLPSGTLSLDFNAPGAGVLDTNGVGTGFPARLGGTGASLPASDTNLFLNSGAGTLEITTTSSDYNGGNALDVNESLGVQLSALGFSGAQDLNVTALFPLPFPDTASFDQFGVVVGPDSLAHTRAGCITFAGKERYSENVRTNDLGVPVNGGGQYFGFGFDPNIPMTVLITRTAGVWHHYIDGVQWDVFTQPTFLNSSADLFAGVFAEDVVNGIHKTISVDSFKARVFNGPRLTVTAEGGNWTITWNVAGNAVLESTTDLTNPNSWLPVVGSPTSPYVIPTPITGLNYYRLKL